MDGGVIGWARTARNGNRYHAITKFEPYDYGTACRRQAVEIFMFQEGEPDWKAERAVKPRKCKDCAVAIRS